MFLLRIAETFLMCLPYLTISPSIFSNGFYNLVAFGEKEIIFSEKWL
jgi:hypothetical protein